MKIADMTPEQRRAYNAAAARRHRQRPEYARRCSRCGRPCHEETRTPRACLEEHKRRIKERKKK